MEQFYVWNLREDIHKYKEYIEDCLDKTVYHLPEYLLAEESAEDGQTKIFIYFKDRDFAIFPGVIRRINTDAYMPGCAEEVYDMITPHEYGGMISNSSKPMIKQKLLEYICRYCDTNNIIFQFVRINPYLHELPIIYKERCEVIHSNSQVYINLEQTEEQIINNYKSNVRRNIRRAEKEGLIFEIAEKDEKNVVIFQIMYQNAMKILEARKFLYFNDKYFRELAACDCCRLGFVRDRNRKVIAASLMLLDKDIVYYHLGCFDRERILERPMNYLMHSMILWSKEKGYKIFHLGGGGKSLMQFKEGYSNTRVDYYIANQICKFEKYEEVCESWKQQFPQYADEKYYPLYRYNE